MAESYAFREIEPRWQRAWEQQRVYHAANPGEPGSEKPPFYVLDFFPYPSGAGLHVGHPLGYIASDIIARYMRMRGRNVLHPMGWDAFGLPAEQYAIETGIHPRVTTRQNIDTYKRQLRTIGLSYDWEREIATCEPDYYRWTQWIFLQIFNAWYDPEHDWIDASGRRVRGAARPIDKLPIPAVVRAQGEAAVRDYQNQHRLAYLSEVPVNWCPALGTVLANEEVTADGRSERGNHPVFQRPLKQWILRITEYADRLLTDLEPLDWPEPIKLMQRNWIGRSEGAYVDFSLDGSDDVIRIFTTRPDTLYGATYMVLAPEHRLVSTITTPEQRAAVSAYVSAAKKRSEAERAEDKRKTGVFTGAYAVNPVNQRRIPIWIADYVLMGYGTGSIMAVPGSDTRDLEFAEAFGLEVVKVVEPPPGVPWRGYEDDGVAVNSPPPGAALRPGACDLNGLPTAEAKRKITRWLEENDYGTGTVQFKLRDWLFSRQRYWGEPFPIVYDDHGAAFGVDEGELPVKLPEIDDFRPHASNDPHAEPQTPLSRSGEWASVRRGDQVLRRELNTMPQWAGSCWYYLRFLDPQNERAFVDRAVERQWMAGRGPDGRAKHGGVDLYMGGAEHAVLHLLYARFWHKVLYDLGHVSTPEPFQKLFNQGMITADSYRDARGVYAPAADVTEGPPTTMEIVETVGDGEPRRETVQTTYYFQGQPVYRSADKMSKSKKNVVNPDAIIAEYGADTLRLYEMYMGPLEKSKPWNTHDIVGVHRFLQRVWRLVMGDDKYDGSAPGHSAAGAAGLHAKIATDGDAALERLLHKTIKKVQGDIERFAFNTAIAQMIVWLNEAQKAERVGRSQIERFLLVLAPFAPHVCEELWQRLGNPGLIVQAGWPTYDEALTQDDTVEIAVQVLGKVRGRVVVSVGASEQEMVSAAMAVEAVAKEVAGRPLKRSIVVKGRLVNLIV